MEIQKVNRNMLLFFGIVAILVVVFFLFRFAKSRLALEEVEIKEEVVGEESASVKTPVKTLKYADALVLYKDKRIQLDANCIATPNNPTFKNNTKIMVDNRSAVSRTVKLGGVMTIPAWGFKIVTLSANVLPATWLLDCGSSQNVATVLIQK